MQHASHIQLRVGWASRYSIFQTTYVFASYGFALHRNSITALLSGGFLLRKRVYLCTQTPQIFPVRDIHKFVLSISMLLEWGSRSLRSLTVFAHQNNPWRLPQCCCFQWNFADDGWQANLWALQLQRPKRCQISLNTAINWNHISKIKFQFL